MLWSLVWSLPFALVAVAGAVVAARAPQGSPWRTPALLGFGLLVASQLVGMVQQLVIVYGHGGLGASYHAALALIGAVNALLNLVGTVLLVVAFVRVPRVAALGRGGAPAAVPADHPHPPAAPGGAYAPPPPGLRKAPGTQGAASTEVPRPGAGG
jgi:hypothetical protein